MSFTPAPWRTHGDCECGEVYGPDGNVGIHRATTLEGFDKIPNQEQQIANARLIAAAPDLLEAADYLLSHDSKDPDDALDQATYIEAWEALKAAAYKARGEGWS